MKANLHAHTTHSIRDSVVKIADYVQRGKELGFEALALSDHGALTGTFEFYKLCKEEEIKPICGVEAYVKEDEGIERLHLILYAIDYVGFQAISKAVKLSNRRIEKRGTLIYPLMNAEILNTCFGPGTSGHGHVFATSACVGGVLAGLNFENESAKTELAELDKSLKNSLATKDAIRFNEDRLRKINEGIDKCKGIKDKKYQNRYKLAQKMRGDEVEKELDTIRAEEAESEKAKIVYASLSEEKKTIQKQITALKKRLPNKDSILNDNMKRHDFLKSYVKDDKSLVEYMEKEALRYQDIFGKGFFFIEVQNHGIPEEIRFMYELDKIAQRTGIPTVAANDAHMLGNTEEDIMARESVMALRFNKLERIREEDKELYIKTEDQLRDALKQILPKDRIDAAIANVDYIADHCNIEFEEHPKHYPVFDKTRNSDELLREMVDKGIKKRFPNGFPSDEYQERIDYELDVIRKMKVSDYHLIVQDLVNFGKKLGYMPEERFEYLRQHISEMSYEEIVSYVEADQSYIGYTIGPGRGSSAGSLVCYVIGITDIDPIKYGLLFERYLNPERVSMPDIDTDYANGYREICIEYTYKRYGAEAVCRIITFSTSAAKSAIKDIAKSIGAAKGCSEEYEALGEALAAEVPTGPKVHISDAQSAFDAMAAVDPRVTEIIKRASLVEGCYHHYGMHAAGVIISDNDNVNEYVPLAWDDGNEQYKTQCNMVEAEELGLLKMDFLGLKNLNIITQILRLIFKRTGKRINPQVDIQEEQDVIKAICASGKTNAIFQLESAGMKDVEKKMGVDCFTDIVLLLAAYRPGPMDSIPNMISVKKGKTAEYRTKELEPILKDTYGSLIYQEQVQQIFRELAGYSYGRADLVRRAMSKKKEKVFLAEKPVFVYGDAQEGIEGCANKGIPADVAEAIFDDMVDFAKYAFNKSHAAAYARVTYILAWLKYHYPLEFMAVAMDWANETQIVALMADAKEMGIKVRPVDINLSEESFTIINDEIYFGFTSVKGIGSADLIVKARKAGEFKSFVDYFLRAHFRSNVTEALIKAGAFDKFCKNRQALKMAFNVMKELAGDIAKYEKSKSEAEEILKMLRDLDSRKAEIDGFDSDYVMSKLKEIGYKNKTIPTIEKQQNTVKRYQKQIDDVVAQVKEVVIPTNIDENVENRLKEEKELIGVYLSGHPLDAYDIPKGVTQVADISSKGRVSICGVISDLKIRKRKTDGADMAFFKLEDRSGVIDVCCFVKEYAEFGMMFTDNATLLISGNVMEDKVYRGKDEEGSGDNEEEPETIYKVSVKFVKEPAKATKEIILELDNIMSWNDVYKYFVAPYVSENAEYRLTLHDKLFGEIRETPVKVNKSFLESELKNFIVA